MMGTKLRHLSDTDLIRLEAKIEALPDKVEIKQVVFAPLKSGAASEWVCLFTIFDNSPADPSFVPSYPNNKQKRSK